MLPSWALDVPDFCERAERLCRAIAPHELGDTSVPLYVVTTSTLEGPLHRMNPRCGAITAETLSDHFRGLTNYRGPGPAMLINVGAMLRCRRGPVSRKTRALVRDLVQRFLLGTVVHELAHILDRGWWRVIEGGERKVSERAKRHVHADDGLARPHHRESKKELIARGMPANPDDVPALATGRRSALPPKATGVDRAEAKGADRRLLAEARCFARAGRRPRHSPWDGHEERFIRATAHLWGRACFLAHSSADLPAAAGKLYGLSPLDGYLSALHGEVLDRIEEPLHNVLDSDPPLDFTARFALDVLRFQRIAAERRARRLGQGSGQSGLQDKEQSR